MKKALLTTLVILFLLSSTIPAFAYDPRYLFTDQEKDNESGLYNFDAREYNPSTGRFNQPDPVLNDLANPQQLKEQTGQNLEQILSDPQALNPYSYARNNPIKYTDPSGQWFGEFFTFRQSWSSFQSELGDAAMYASPLMSTAIDHPYITGAVTGIAGGLLAKGIIFYGARLLLGLGLIGNSAAQSKEQLIKVGTSFGKLGTVIENASGKISGFTSKFTKNPFHGLDQAITRGVSPQTLLDTVNNPLVRLQQSSGNILYLTKNALVVLDKAGQLVTTYGSQFFQPQILDILNQIKK